MNDRDSFTDLLFAFEQTPVGTAEARAAQHQVFMNLHRRLAEREADERLLQMMTATLRIVLIPTIGMALIELVRRLVA